MNKIDVQILVHQLRTIDHSIRGSRAREAAERPTPFQVTAARYWLRMRDFDELRIKLNQVKPR